MVNRMISGAGQKHTGNLGSFPKKVRKSMRTSSNINHIEIHTKIELMNEKVLQMRKTQGSTATSVLSKRGQINGDTLTLPIGASFAVVAIVPVVAVLSSAERAAHVTFREEDCYNDMPVPIEHGKAEMSSQRKFSHVSVHHFLPFLFTAKMPVLY